jgi:hypothetical protein
MYNRRFQIATDMVPVFTCYARFYQQCYPVKLIITNATIAITSKDNTMSSQL